MEARRFAIDDATAAQPVAEALAATIKTRIQSDAMPMPPASSDKGDLTVEEEATLVAWVDSLSL